MLAAALLIGAPLASQAQGLDAGRVYESLQPRQAERVQPSAPSVILRSRPRVGPSLGGAGDALLVKRWRIEGARSLPVETLEAAAAPYAGQTLSVVQLQEVADHLAQVYRDAGFLLTQAAVLPQTVRDGEVVITVREDRLERLDVAIEPLLPAVALAAVQAAQPVGQPVNTQALEHVLLRVNSLPGGGQASAELAPGVGEDGSLVSIRYAPAPRATGMVQIDHNGNRFTGRSRVIGSLVVNEPLGRGDQFSATALTTGRALTYGQLGYLAPLSLSTSAGVSISALNYDLCCQPAGQVADGSVWAASFDLAQFWKLTRSQQVTGFAGLDLRRQESGSAGPNPTDRRLQVLRLGARGHWVGTAQNVWSAALHVGRADLSGNTADLSADSSGAQVHGGFSKAVASYSRLQNLNSAWSWSLHVRGQANLGRNLESSERLSLGGADGVRAYPAGEALGDSGLLGGAELRYAVASQPGLGLIGFVDAGHVRRFTKNVAALQMAGVPNNYGLAGFGVGLTYQLPSTSVALMVAEPLGSNPGADTAGNNADGKPDGGTQFWLSVTLRFP